MRRQPTCPPPVPACTACLQAAAGAEGATVPFEGVVAVPPGPGRQMGGLLVACNWDQRCAVCGTDETAEAREIYRGG